jgi:hypothetical protein
MFLFDEIFLPHTFDSIIFLIFFILTKHNLAKGTTTKYLQKFKFFEVADVILVGLTLENNLTFCLYLFILLNALSI